MGPFGHNHPCKQAPELVPESDVSGPGGRSGRGTLTIAVSSYSRVFIIAIGCFCSLTATGQERRLTDILARLPVLEGRIPAYHATGAREEARRVQGMLEKGVDYYRAKFGMELPFQLALLGPDEWQHMNPKPAPYAQFLPGVTTTGSPPVNVVMLPVGRGHALDALFQRIAGSPPLSTIRLNPDDLSARFVALVGFHELGHVYARGYGLVGAPGWLNEFLASYFAYTFLSAEHPEDARIWQLASEAFVQQIKPQRRALSDIHSGVGAKNYVWYQGSLQVRVEQVHRQLGIEFLHKLRAIRKDREFPQETTVVLELLEQIAPGFHEWAKLHHAGPQIESF